MFQRNNAGKLELHRWNDAGNLKLHRKKNAGKLQLHRKNTETIKSESSTGFWNVTCNR